MKKNLFQGLVVINFLVLVCGLRAQQLTGFTEDFNDNILTGWEVPGVHQRTYTLTEADSVLRIDYHRTEASWEWDNFNFSPPVINISQHPIISVRYKSNIRTLLTFKPTYGETDVGWLQKYLPDDNQWHTIFFQIENPRADYINRIYMYLDGGTTVPKSGTVYFDDLKIGDQAEVVADLLDLEKAIEDAWALYQNSIEGIEEGQFTPGSKAILKAAIDTAQSFLDSSPTSQDATDQAVWDLYDACVSFETGAVVADIEVVDELATKETKYLFKNLDSLARTNLLFGMQDATGYGVGWEDDDDRSDVKDVCGSYPAIYGWGLGGIARGEESTRLKYRMTSAFERGGINTMEWHQYDPLGRGFYAEAVNYERIVRLLLPGGEYHDFYKTKLKRIAHYLKGLRGSRGQSIPVIFRPYHENNGSWFWWGADYCTPEEYTELWQFTETYLKDSLNVHNLLYAYSPDRFDDKPAYLERYPGDDFIDILGTDLYFFGSVDNQQISEYVRRMRDIVELSEQRHKIAALTETGRESLDIYDWFTRIILNPLKQDSVATNIAYFAVWRNANEYHFFAPYPGHPSVPDFLIFFDDPYTMFESDLPDMYALTTVDTLPPYFTVFPDTFFVSFDTLITLEMITNERAVLRYSEIDQPYHEMPHEFQQGQGITRHTTMLSAEQGKTYNYYVRATDQYGNVMDTSVVISFKVDIYAAPIHWTHPDYDVSQWKSGPAPLGFGASGIATQIAAVRTVYFRHEFSLEDVEDISYFSIILNYDNGAVLYLNGEEVGRINVPFGDLGYDNWASSDNSGFKAFILDANQLPILRNGTNILTVELHQAEDDSSDLLFELRALAPDPVVEFGSNWYYYDFGTKPEDQHYATDVAESERNIPHQFRLFQNYPNPFNSNTRIRYQLDRSCQVELIVYNILGKKVRTLINEKQKTGSHRVIWDGRNDQGSLVASGIYLYQIKTDQFSARKKLILLK